MEQSAAGNRYRMVGRRAELAFLLLAVLCVAMMPSLYRGGASVPHAHGFLQFWLTGPERAFDHHRHDHDAGRSHIAQSDAQVGTHPVAGQTSPPDASDNPTVSHATSTGGTITVIVIAVAALLALAAVHWSRVVYGPWRNVLVGLVLPPESPPPRTVVVS